MRAAANPVGPRVLELDRHAVHVRVPVAPVRGALVPGEEGDFTRERAELGEGGDGGEARVADAERGASDARAALARVVQAEEERERESAEAEKEWEDKLTEARRAATEAESRRAEAESLVVEAKEAATRAILRVEEEQQEHLTEARRTAAVAEAKMAKAEADAAEAKKCEADAAVRAELAEAEARALQLVKDHESIIRALADALVEHETLDAAALKAVIKPDTAVPV